MSDNHIIPEAAVEAAAKALNSDFPNQWEKTPEWIQADIKREIRAALEAAAPHMLAALASDAAAPSQIEQIARADAWDLGMEYGHNAEGRLLDKWDANPYRTAK